MKDKLYKTIESTFQNSTSRDELFDAFGDALKYNISDFELYKILLANPVLSADEIKMYTEKLLKEISLSTYHILMWTAKIFETRSSNISELIDSVNYYERAMNTRRTEHESLLALLNIYNYDVETEVNRRILNLVENGVRNVFIKSKVYYALANLYKHLNNIKTASNYLALAERSVEFERE